METKFIHEVPGKANLRETGARRVSGVKKSLLPEMSSEALRTHLQAQATTPLTITNPGYVAAMKAADEQARRVARGLGESGGGGGKGWFWGGLSKAALFLTVTAG